MSAAAEKFPKFSNFFFQIIQYWVGFCKTAPNDFA